MYWDVIWLVVGMVMVLVYEIKNFLVGICGVVQFFEQSFFVDEINFIVFICDEVDWICDFVDCMEVFVDR